MEVAFTPPTRAMTTAKRAGYRHPPLRTARMVRASIQPRAAQGMTMAEIRAM
jgi:hypothetical protein